MRKAAKGLKRLSILKTEFFMVLKKGTFEDIFFQGKTLRNEKIFFLWRI